MLEKDMYPLFAKWLDDNTDLYTQELLIPASACFDFIAIKGSHVIVYELKLRDAKKVIQQANIAHLWCDHSYVVMPKDKVHLAMKRQHRLQPCSGIMSLDMTDESVEVLLPPRHIASHVTFGGLRKAMMRTIIECNISDHLKFVWKWRDDSYRWGRKLDSKNVRGLGWLDTLFKKLELARVSTMSG
jgi:hypothetical protein